MSHLDDDVIAGAAIGDALSAEQSAHLGECAACNATLDELREIAEVARTSGRQEPLLVPPERVWSGILSEIRADAAGEAEADADADSMEGSARRPRRAWLVAAAAAVIVVGGVGIGLAVSSASDPMVLATAPLVDLATEADAGTATVEERPDGTRVLVVNTTVAEPTDADLEVWLIDPNIEGMVSLGFLTADQGEFVIPAGYEVADYPIVDVSVEPRDGVPTHSGDSVTRGTLTPKV